MKPEDLLHPRPEGLYCPPGDFYIDPVRPVPRALITHGHADHARAGHDAVMATRRTLEIMALRYGADFCQTRQEATREAVDVNGVSACGGTSSAVVNDIVGCHFESPGGFFDGAVPILAAEVYPTGTPGPGSLTTPPRRRRPLGLPAGPTPA